MQPKYPISGSGQVLALGAASVASAAVGQNTSIVRLVASGACHVDIGPTPVATAATGMYLAPSREGEYFRIGVGEKVAVIQDGAATGNLYLTEMTG